MRPNQAAKLRLFLKSTKYFSLFMCAVKKTVFSLPIPKNSCTFAD